MKQIKKFVSSTHSLRPKREKHMFQDDFDDTPTPSSSTKKLGVGINHGSDDDEEFIHIGNTKYYKVRKGNQHYRIVAGKKMTDHEFC